MYLSPETITTSNYSTSTLTPIPFSLAHLTGLTIYSMIFAQAQLSSTLPSPPANLMIDVNIIIRYRPIVPYLDVIPSLEH